MINEILKIFYHPENDYSFSAVIRPKVKLTIKPMINTTNETNHITILVGKPGNTAKRSQQQNQ